MKIKDNSGFFKSFISPMKIIYTTLESWQVAILSPYVSNNTLPKSFNFFKIISGIINSYLHTMNCLQNASETLPEGKYQLSNCNRQDKYFMILNLRHRYFKLILVIGYNPSL